MKVTIGVPFYNSEKYIGTAIRSILSQTFDDFELILSDDGSTDASLDIARSFNEPRIKIISDGVNRGIVYRLNEQIKLARGEYFARMDSDDIMFPDRIEKQVNYLNENRSADVIGSHAIVIDSDNSILGKRISKINNTATDIFNNIPFIHPSVMGRTEWFRKYFYAEGVDGAEDADLWKRSFGESVFCLVEEPLLFYRDPLNIKVKTYLFRQKQIMQAIKKYRRLDPDDAPSYQVIIRANLKSLAFRIASVTGLSAYIVARRNNHLSDDDIAFYQSILSKVLN